jgi:hypothetical protein
MLARYVTLGVAGTLLLAVVLLLVRPLIFSFASPRDDTKYTVTAAAEADARGPQVIELPLNDSHNLPGEVRVHEHVTFTVVVSPIPGGGYAAVAAWSPTHDCPIGLGSDRLVDCAGDAWTYEGIPINAADPPLQRFPLTTTDGMVVVDFTRPYPAVGS